MCYFYNVKIAIDGDVTFCSECKMVDFKATDSETKENVINKNSLFDVKYFLLTRENIFLLLKYFISILTTQYSNGPTFF